MAASSVGEAFKAVAKMVGRKKATSKTGMYVAALTAMVCVGVPLVAIAAPAALSVAMIAGTPPGMQFCSPKYSQSDNSSGVDPTKLSPTQQQVATTIIATTQGVTNKSEALIVVLAAAILEGKLTADSDAASTATDDTPVGPYRRTVRGGWGTLTELRDVGSATRLILEGNGATRAGIMNVDQWETQPVGYLLKRIGIEATPATTGSAVSVAQQILVAQKVVAKTPGAVCGGGPLGPISADQKQLASNLMAQAAEGRLTGDDRHMQQIRDIAHGIVVPNCGVDIRILQILVAALQKYDRVGFSDINRRCTGQIEGAGVHSSHYINGGGHAIDLIFLDGALSGNDAHSRDFIQTLDPIMPSGSVVGQQNCRSANPITTTNFSQISDSCTHLHLAVPGTEGTLTIPPR